MERRSVLDCGSCGLQPNFCCLWLDRAQAKGRLGCFRAHFARLRGFLGLSCFPGAAVEHLSITGSKKSMLDQSTAGKIVAFPCDWHSIFTGFMACIKLAQISMLRYTGTNNKLAMQLQGSARRKKARNSQQLLLTKCNAASTD